jgi:hypothetical protein
LANSGLANLALANSALTNLVLANLPLANLALAAQNHLRHLSFWKVLRGLARLHSNEHRH